MRVPELGRPELVGGGAVHPVGRGKNLDAPRALSVAWAA